MPIGFGGGTGGGGGKVNSVTAGDTSVVVGGTAADPTVRTADLATIAADHATSGSVAMGTNKLTGLAAGTTAGDSVRYEQALLSGAVTAADTSVVVAGTGVAPTIRTATLDVIAADHAPAAAVAMNAQKITGLANGSAASDAAAFGQLQWAKICSLTLSGAQANFDTNTILGGNIPATYTSLLVLCVGRGDAVASVVNLTITVNNDSGANYYRELGQFSATTAGAGEALAATNGFLGNIPAANATAGRCGQFHGQITAYAGTTFHKILQADTAYSSDNSSGDQLRYAGATTWASTAAITRLALNLSSGNFVTGSVFALYGLN